MARSSGGEEQWVVIEGVEEAVWTLLPDLQVVNLSQNKLMFVPIELFQLEGIRSHGVHGSQHGFGRLSSKR